MNTVSTGRSLTILGTLIACAIVGFILGAQNNQPSARAETKNAHTWEYSELTWNRNLDTNKMRFVLELPSGIVQAEAPAALCVRLGTRSANNTTTDVLNFLGSQGWELVSHSQLPSPGAGLRAVDSVWTLKRAR